MNLCRFFLWEVFFLGTARNIESQRPERINGILILNEVGRKLGIGMHSEWVIWAEKLKAVLKRNVGFKTAAHGKVIIAEEAGESV